jgi:hypothetical protein
MVTGSKTRGGTGGPRAAHPDNETSKNRITSIFFILSPFSLFNFQ